MSISVKNFIIETIKNYDDGTGVKIDTSEGSVFNDLFIGPLTEILSRYDIEHKQTINDLAISNPESISTEKMDAIAAKYLITRNVGTKANGRVHIYYTNPQAVKIVRGMQISTASGQAFVVTQNYNISRTQMASNSSDFPYYTAGPISVEAVNNGSEYNIESLTKFTGPTSVLGSYAKIINRTKFTSGVTTETNTQLYDRITRTVFGKTLSSPASIKGYLLDYAPEIVDIEVVGAGHPSMIRDLSYVITDVNNIYTENFQYVYSGLHNPALNHKMDEAYLGVFTDFNPGSGISLPSLSDFRFEFSNEDYAGISKLVDSKYTEHSNLPVLADFATTPPSDKQLQQLTLSGNWQLRDGFTDDGNVSDFDEIGYSANKLRLGKTFDVVNNTNIKVNAKIKEIQAIKQAIVDEEYEIATNLTEAISSDTSVGNFAPIVQKEIDLDEGIQIQLAMSTTDNTENGQICYLTTMRRDGIYSPHDGYGLAWKKQPAFMIRLAADNYGENTQLQEADEALFQEYWQTPFSSVVGALSDPSNKQYWFYNVYVVDNDVLEEDVWVGGEQILDQGTGRNQFLVAGKAWIEPGIEYDIKINITEGLGIEGYIDDEKVVNYGARYPNYIAMADYTYNANEITSRTNRGTYFGIGIGNTKNSEWYVGNLVINRTIEGFPMHLFKMPVLDIPEYQSNGITFNYYGLGFDKTRSTDPLYSGLANSYIKLYAYNFDIQEWAELGSNQVAYPYDENIEVEEIPDYLISGTIPPNGIGSISTYLDGNNFVYLLAVPYNSGPDFPGNTDHTIRSYYIQLSNGETAGVHRGNAVDVYVHDPKNIETEIVNIGIIGSNIVNLKDVPQVSRYIQDIIEVYQTDAGSGDVITTFDTSEYSIYNNNKGTSFSSESDYRLVFNDTGIAGTSIGLKYRYWSAGATINNLLVNSEDRYPTVDYKAKVMPVAIVSIDKLQFSGSATEDEVKELIKNYFNTTTEATFDKTQMLSILSTLGLSYVNLSEFYLTIKEYDERFRFTETELNSATQTYTLKNDISRFYCHVEDLSGVVKVDV